MTASSLPRHALRALAAAILGTALLAGCGGGTSQVDQFIPDRILSLGDELNYLTDDGHKYTVNAVDSTSGAVVCTTSPLWIQQVAANRYGKLFSQCPGTGSSPDLTALRLSTVGARVDDVVGVANARLASGGFTDTDLVTVLVGMHDVLDQYALYDGTNEADLVSALQAKGTKLASMVNSITATGARVLVSTTIDVGLTPYAVQQKADVGDDRPGLLTRLTDAFNTAMRLDLVNDGSKIGLLLADDLSRAMHRVPANYSLASVDKAVCLEAQWSTPNCTTKTLIAAASSNASTYLWADQLHPGTVFHYYLGTQAASRLNNLPF